MPRQVALGGLGLIAILLVGIGFAWKWLHPPQSYWSEEKAEQYVAAFDAVHAAESALVAGPDTAVGVDYRAARERFEMLQSELERARSARDRTGTLLVLAGLMLLVAVYGLWRLGASSSDEPGGQGG